jgi:Ferritin-like
MAMQIEYPESPVPRTALLALVPGETFPSIGEFYDAIVTGFQNLKKGFPYDQTKQIKGSLGIFIVDGFDAAVRAIRQIQQQGEGASMSPYYAPNQLSHFYAFGELYFAKKYAYNSATQTGY